MLSKLLPGSTGAGPPHKMLVDLHRDGSTKPKDPKEEILQQRKEKKRLTLERWKQYNRYSNKQSPDQHQIANSS